MLSKLLWKLVVKRYLLDLSPGFEAGGQATPSDIAPWFIIGDESLVVLSTDRSSCFDRNKIALRMDVLCDSKGPLICPAGGVGVYNPGFWGMVNICILQLCLITVIIPALSY